MKQTFLKIEKDRNADHILLKAFSKFEAVQEGLTNSRGLRDDLIPLAGRLYEHVSAPYLLARLISGFEGLNINMMVDRYKCTWGTAVKHKPTGIILTFYDFKGASSVGLSFKDNTRVNFTKSFIKDTNSLLKALINDRMPHTYDNCVVGEIA